MSIEGFGTFNKGDPIWTDAIKAQHKRHGEAIQKAIARETGKKSGKRKVGLFMLRHSCASAMDQIEMYAAHAPVHTSAPPVGALLKAAKAAKDADNARKRQADEAAEAASVYAVRAQRQQPHSQ